jgi:hypothetical protein
MWSAGPTAMTATASPAIMYDAGPAVGTVA